MNTFLGIGTSVLFGNTVRASTELLTDCIRPITEGGSIKIIGLASGSVVTTLVEFLEALELVTEAGGGCISVGSGVYTVMSTIVLPSNIKIVGCGKETTIFRAAAGLNAPIFSIDTVDSVKLEDLQIDSNSPASTVPTSDVFVNSSTKVSIESCTFVNSANSGTGSLGFYNVINCQVKSSVFSDMDNVGVGVDTNSFNVNITDNVFDTVINCAIDSLGNEVIIKGNQIQESGPLCVRSGKAVVDCNTISSNNNTGIAVNGGGLGNHIVTNNIIDDAGDSGISSAGASFNSCLIVNNIIRQSASAGIELGDNLNNAFIDGNKLTGNLTGIVVSTVGNDNVCVSKNKSVAVYNADGAINPNDDEAVVTAAGSDLSMTLADINKCSVGHVICIENDAASTNNVSVTYNSGGSDEIILLPSQNKVLKWNGRNWCVINKDYFHGELTAGQSVTLASTVELAFDTISSSDNFDAQFTGPIGPGQSYTIFFRTTGMYQVNTYATMNGGATTIGNGQRTLGIVVGGTLWSANTDPYELEAGAVFPGQTSQTGQLVSSSVINVSDLTIPLRITGFQNIAASIGIGVGGITIMRL